MPLISTIEEIQAVLPKLISTTSETSTLPNFGHTEDKYIVPIIGATLYNTLVTNYNASTLDADEIILVNKLRRAIVPYAFLDDLGLYILMLQDSGAKKISQGGTEPVRGWEVQELKTTLIKKATEGIEHSLNYLFENKIIYPEWTSSPEYVKLKTLLLKSGTEFNDNYTLFQPQRTYFIMRGIMNDVQLLYLEESIGKELLEYLRDAPIPTADEKVCISLLKKSLAFFTVAKACKHFSVSFSDGGFTILGEKSTNALENQMNQAADLQLLEMKIKECLMEGDSYLELSRNKLVALYEKAGVSDAFKAAFAPGPLKVYIKPADRTSGNENRKIYSLP